MARFNVVLLAALAIPAVALAGDLAATAPLSAWQHADVAARRELIDTLAEQLRVDAGIAGHSRLPYGSVIGCVDHNRAPDHLDVHDHVVAVTAGLAVVLCLKMHVPELRAAGFHLRARPAGER